MTIVLLGSVFLPEFVLDPLAAALRSRGHEVSVVAPWEPASAVNALAAYSGAVERVPDPFLVAHSNAGHFVAPLADRHRLTGTVFVDAAFPPRRGGDWPVVSAELAARVPRDLSDRAQPWTRWWSPAEMREVLPNPRLRREIDEGAPRVPVSYLSSRVGASRSWTSRLRMGYLAFGDTYRAERVRAAGLGWPVEVLPLGHLGMLDDPGLVADGVLRLRDLVGDVS